MPLIKISYAEVSIESKPFTSKNLKLMRLDVAARDEQDEGKKKKLKLKHAAEVSQERTNEEGLFNVVRREKRTKNRNDPRLQRERITEKGTERGQVPENSAEKGDEKVLVTEKSEEIGENDLEKDQFEGFEVNIPEKVQEEGTRAEKGISPVRNNSRESEKSVGDSSDEQRTITEQRSDSAHSTSKEVMAPLSKVYSRGLRKLWRTQEHGATSALVESFNKAASELDMTTHEKVAGVKQSEGGTELLHIDSSGGKESERTKVIEDTIPFHVNEDSTSVPPQVEKTKEGIAIGD